MMHRRAGMILWDYAPGNNIIKRVTGRFAQAVLMSKTAYEMSIGRMEVV